MAKIWKWIKSKLNKEEGGTKIEPNTTVDTQEREREANLTIRQH